MPPTMATGISIRHFTFILPMALLSMAIVFYSSIATAQTFEVLYQFTNGSGGWGPNALIRDAEGNLYGTAQGDIHNNSSCNGPGCGIVFRVDPTGAETLLYAFTGGADGKYPLGALLRDVAGNLYGTTEQGGVSNGGTIFKVDPSGNETVLYSFAGGSDGASPVAGLLRDNAGAFYGTTKAGGAFGRGTIFRWDSTRGEVILHSFGGSGDGATPVAGLVEDPAGNLYGTTAYGGTGDVGTIFEFEAEGAEKVLHSFGGNSGAFPMAGLIRDAAGNLYGTTAGSAPYYEATIFRLDPTRKLTVLNTIFLTNGSRIITGLVSDTIGNLYGTALMGGTYGEGVVFKLDRNGVETILYTFSGEGASYPWTTLVRDAEGNLFGTSGGGYYLGGVVYEITP
jgi:uncharacterized repeat protein (TIGR03803 family)